MPQFSFNSPLGALTVTEEDGKIVSLDWGWASQSWETPLLCEAKVQIDDYFDRKRTAFNLPLDPPGTVFQKKVWAGLLTIPFGSVQTYGTLAATVATSARAIGSACGRNPIPLLIPCHRVIAGDKTLGGYSGLNGVETKAFLLRLEGFNDFVPPSVSEMFEDEDD